MKTITIEKMNQQAKNIPEESRLHFFKLKNKEDAVYSFYNINTAAELGFLEPVAIGDMSPKTDYLDLTAREIAKISEYTGIPAGLIFESFI